MKKICSQKGHIAVFILLMVLLVMNLFFWGNRKEGFHCDELYSYHFVCQTDYPSINGERDGKQWFNNWYAPEYFMDYLTVAREEAFDVAGTLNSVREDVHPPVFYLLLEFVCSAASVVLPGVFSKWFGILLNVIFFVFTILVLYALAKKMLKSKHWAIAVCVLYGFSAGAVSTVMFLRMYMIFTFTCVLFTWLNFQLWEQLWEGKEKEKSVAGIYAALTGTTILGILNHYYFLIYAFFTCITIWGYALLHRKFHFAVRYMAAMGTGIVGSLLMWPEMLEDIFGGYRGTEAFDNLSDGTGWGSGIKGFVSITNSELLGGNISVVFVAILLIGLVCLRFAALRWNVRTEKTTGGIRYLFERKEKISQIACQLSVCDMFFLQIAAAVSCYGLLLARIAPSPRDRYIFNIFPMVIMIVVYLIYRVTAGFSGKFFAKMVLGIMILLIICGYVSPGVSYLFDGTSYEMKIAEDFSHIPTFYVTNGNRYRVAGDSVYLSKARNVYPTKREKIDELSEALMELNGTADNEYVVYVDLDFQDKDSVLEEIKTELNVSDAQWMFNTQYSAAYVLR